MLTSTQKILARARDKGYAVGAFNVYNLEGALAVVRAASELKSPVILQVLPSALILGGSALIHLCLEAGRSAPVPVAVHLDHCPSKTDIQKALDAGISSVMADGSMLEFEDNLNFTREMSGLATRALAGVEGELGRITGKEDGMTAHDLEARMTDPDQAAEFARETGICALAVCIGNIHGVYEKEPDLDFDRLEAIRNRVDLPLVLHGSSGLPDWMIQKAVSLRVCKFNVNTEVRSAYIRSMGAMFAKGRKPELTEIMKQGMAAMAVPVKEKIELFGSAGKAQTQ